MICVFDVSEAVAGHAPPGLRILVSGGCISLVDAVPVELRLRLLSMLVLEVGDAWAAASDAGHQMVTLARGTRFAVSTYQRTDGVSLLVIRTAAEAAGAVELDPADVTVFERQREALN